VSQRGIPTQPAAGSALETDTGGAFFNVNGYLGTVTVDGGLIVEEEHHEDEYPTDAERDYPRGSGHPEPLRSTRPQRPYTCDGAED
jgi:hypothetical protein